MAARRLAGGVCAHVASGERGASAATRLFRVAQAAVLGVSRRWGASPALGRCALALLSWSGTSSEPARAFSYGFSARQGRLPAEPGQENLLGSQPGAAEAQVG